MLAFGGNLDIEFGLFLDRAPWGHNNSFLGTVRVGVQGFSNLLQTRLGLSRPAPVHSARIKQFHDRLAAADRTEAWFHNSFETDRWATATELLAARDELMSHGWAGSLAGSGSDRLTALASLEDSPLPLSPALADAAVEILADLESAEPGSWPLGITRIRLQHPLDSFPAVWRRILSRLQERGTVLIPPVEVTKGAPEVAALVVPSEWEAAEHAARWLAAGENSKVAIVAGTGTSVLDHALAQRGLPRLGVGRPSKLRAIDQIIPLFFSVIWGPADVQLLAEFFSLPVTPVRRRAARILLGALSQQPGTGGDAWLDGRANIAADTRLGPGVADDLDRLFNRELLSEDTATGAELLDRATWLADRLRANLVQHQELQKSIDQLDELAVLLDGQPRVSRIDLRRMVDTVISARTSALSSAEAAPWQVVASPLEIADSVDAVLWWGCQDDSSTRARYWTPAERMALERVGVLLPDPAQLAELATSLTVGALRQPQVVLAIRASELNGEATIPHPVLDALAFEIGTEASALAVNPAALVRDNYWELAGRMIPVLPVASRDIVLSPAVMDLGPRPTFLPSRVSYSQLTTLMGCSMKWVLERQGRLRVAEAQNVPTGGRMVGTLVHRIVEDLFAQLRKSYRAVPTPEEVDAKLAELVPLYASELLLPGKGSRLAGLRPTIQRSVITLFETLQRAGIAIHDVEKPFELDANFTIDGVPTRIAVSGSIDMAGSDPDGRPVVIDLKWSNWQKHFGEDIAAGNAAQLALYQWALEQGPSEMDIATDNPSTAYFLLKQGEFVSAAPLFGTPIEAQRTTSETWRRTVRGAEFSITEVVNGRFAAAARSEYVEAAAPEAAASTADRLFVSPPCHFCDFAVACGLKGDLS